LTAESAPRVDEHPEGSDSLILEIQAARDAAVAHIGMVAATASKEAELSVASVVAMASATLLSVAFLIVAWVCLVALAVWFAVSAGWSLTAALGSAAIVNVAAAFGCRFVYLRLARNIGFSRTRKLLFG
jgi:hypothetical protein